MMCYKDMTFCPGPCGNTSCERHRSIVEGAYQDGGFLKENPMVPVAWFVDVPVDCKDYKAEDRDINGVKDNDKC